MKRVLVVDDDEDARELLQLALERRGYRVTVASSFADARAALEREPFYALVTDIELDDGSGLGLREIAPVSIACTLTGHASPADAERAKNAGFHAHLVKPVDLDALCDVLGSPAATSP
jgi:DNA-binding NtrC family response regulator